MKHIFAKTALFALAGTLSATAATLPTAKEVQAKMGMGFNIGNSMEVPNNPTAWGNLRSSWSSRKECRFS